MTAPFLRAASLDAIGVEHGFGTRSSSEGLVAGLQMAIQVHGDRVVRVPRDEHPLEADGLLSLETGQPVGVRTADCVPILLADRARRGVAAVHAGWRGSAAGIAERAVEVLCAAIHAPPDDIVAVIGPHIGVCCYEVDAPVRERIAESSVFRPGRTSDRWWLDLERLNRLQLERAGIRDVSHVGECTCCTPERYPSYRRDGTGGRMIHYVSL